jgi:hypothetical protein
LNQTGGVRCWPGAVGHVVRAFALLILDAFAHAKGGLRPLDTHWGLRVRNVGHEDTEDVGQCGRPSYAALVANRASSAPLFKLPHLTLLPLILPKRAIAHSTYGNATTSLGRAFVKCRLIDTVVMRVAGGFPGCRLPIVALVVPASISNAAEIREQFFDERASSFPMSQKAIHANEEHPAIVYGPKNVQVACRRVRATTREKGNEEICQRSETRSFGIDPLRSTIVRTLRYSVMIFVRATNMC